MIIKNLLIISVTTFSLVTIQAIWPPSYKINLTHEEIFVISEEISGDDVNDVYEAEDEMIKEEELKKFNIEKDSEKYLRLHQLTLRHNKEDIKNLQPLYNKKQLKKPIEANYEELQPWEAGFVNKNGILNPIGKIVYDPNKFMKENKTEKNKRREIANKDVNYDYGSLKAEFDSNFKTIKVSNDTLNYTETKEEESVKDAFKAMVGATNKTRNCTAEEKKGIGIAAAGCFWSDLHKPGLNKKERSGIFRRITTIILVWISVYLFVAIPCWCQKGNILPRGVSLTAVGVHILGNTWEITRTSFGNHGSYTSWCCCCFQCKICKPQERIDLAKKYLLDNPIGVYHTPDNKKLTYTPTSYEKYAQNKLEKALLKL